MTDVVRFGGLRLDFLKGTLATPQGDVTLRPKANAVLTHLARNLGRVVPKDELLDAAWPDVVVTENSLTQAIAEIRRRMGADSDLLRNIARRGYLLADDLHPPVAPAKQLVVAVLRFANERPGETEDALVDGLAADIVNGLGKFGGLLIVARSSSFVFRSYDTASWARAAAELDADFVVEGSVRRAGADARVSVSLADVKTRTQLWGQQYEAHDLEIFAVQQEIVGQILNRLVSRIGEIERLRPLTPGSLDAHHNVVRAAALLEDYGRSDSVAARRLLETAIADDPTIGRAHAYIALSTIMTEGLGAAPPALLAEARRTADLGAQLAPTDAVVHRILSTVQVLERSYGAAEASARTALELNPNDADCVGWMGHLLVLRGKVVEASSWQLRASRLNPLFTQWYDFSRALGAYQLGEYAAAAALLERLPHSVPWVRVLFDASRAMRDINAHEPLGQVATKEDFKRQVDMFGLEHEADRQHLMRGLAAYVAYQG